MPSEKSVRRLEDIIENAKAVLRYTAGMDLAALAEDRKARLAQSVVALFERFRGA